MLTNEEKLASAMLISVAIILISVALVIVLSIR
jgi:hypothetical protein